VAAGDVYGANGLIWAINQANTDGIRSVICLTNSTYTLTSAYLTDTGLPLITSEIEIQGNSAVLMRGSTAPALRIFRVIGTGNLQLHNLVLMGGSLPNADGGAIYNFTGRVSLTSVIVSGSTATNGGAIYNNNGIVAAASSNFTTNRAPDGSGGAIANDGASATVTLTNSSVNGNEAASGGGLFNSDGTITISGSTINNNTAVSAGGIFNNDFGIVNIDNSQMSGNASVAYGGAISTNGATMRINNSCVTSNASPIGSGIANLDTSATPVNAEDNWWGAADGPSGDGPGSGDAVYGNVDYTPFKTARPAFCS
jgi:hypothetical protein